MAQFHYVTKVRIGDRVVTNEAKWGTVVSVASEATPHEPTWWNVEYDDGHTVMQDMSRMTTNHPFGDPDPAKEEQGFIATGEWYEWRKGPNGPELWQRDYVGAPWSISPDEAAKEEQCST